MLLFDKCCFFKNFRENHLILKLNLKSSIMKIIFLAFVFTLFIPLFTLHTLQAQEIGPKNGSLVIVGGGQLSDEVLQRFIDLAGGPQARIVIIPTAGGGDDYGVAYEGRAFKPFQKLGATNLTVLHTYDKKVADTEEFAKVIREATGVWFPGGRQWRLADAYSGTKTEQALWDLLDRGGVIGGTSAGATIQGSYLARGDTKNNTTMMGDHEIGFGFVKNVAIDQHLLVRNRQFDLIEVIKAKPELLGIGLDEGTAIVVQGDRFEVVGPSFVAIYDPKILEKTGRFYFLRAGDRFDLKNRTASRPGSRLEALDLPVEFGLERN